MHDVAGRSGRRLDDPEVRGVLGFAEPMRRARYLELLDAPARRDELVSELLHEGQLDWRRWAVPLPHTGLDPGAVTDLLISYGAPGKCWVICDDDVLDGREWHLREAAERIVNAPVAALVSCVPGRLAYLQRPGGNTRALLVRPQGRREGGRLADMGASGSNGPVVGDISEPRVAARVSG